MYKDNEKCTTQPVPQCTVSDEILGYASSLAEQINYLAERVHGKLRPVMVEDYPKAGCCEAVKSREYPPLFNELRNKFDSIKYSIESIESALSRTEL